MPTNSRFRMPMGTSCVGIRMQTNKDLTSRVFVPKFPDVSGFRKPYRGCFKLKLDLWDLLQCDPDLDRAFAEGDRLPDALFDWDVESADCLDGEAAA